MNMYVVAANLVEPDPQVWKECCVETKTKKARGELQECHYCNVALTQPTSPFVIFPLTLAFPVFFPVAQHAATVVRFALRAQEEAAKVPKPYYEGCLGSVNEGLQMRIGRYGNRPGGNNLPWRRLE